MAKVSGTLVLLYADGQAIALQRGLDITAEQDLPDATNKESGGWAEHEKGLRNAIVNFDALLSTTGLSAADLLAYITGRTSLLMVITGGISYPMIGEVDLSTISLSGVQEVPMALTGSLKINGPLYHLKGTSASLITDPDGGGTDYDTFTISGIAVTSAINEADAAYAMSNNINVSDEDVIKVAVFLTLNSGQAPKVRIRSTGGDTNGNQETLVEGLNMVILTMTGDDASSKFELSNTAASNYALSSIYVFKYVAT